MKSDKEFTPQKEGETNNPIIKLSNIIWVRNSGEEKLAAWEDWPKIKNKNASTNVEQNKIKMTDLITIH